MVLVPLLERNGKSKNMSRPIYPESREALIAIIQTQDREIVAIKNALAEHGLAAELLRKPENFHAIDDVLEKHQNCPFTFTEIFNEWVTATSLLTTESAKVVRNLKTHFRDLLKENGYVIKTGGHGRTSLWRVVANYGFCLRNAKELKWRKLGEVEGTYLVPCQ